MPSTVFATSFTFILSPLGNAFASSFSSSPPGNAFLLYQRTLPVVILVESWTVLAVFKPIGTKPLTLTFYFQLVDQYQPIALSGIHWWQSIKRSKGDQQYSRFSCISLRGMNGPRFISSWVYRATVVNFVSLRGLTNHGVNFLSLRGLTNHGIDATDRLRTIYVRAYHALMASSLQSVNLLTERNQLRLSRFNY